MSYDPRPIDTSHVSLPDDIQSLLEALARNTHEVWARRRLDEGWHWGPERNDARKEHPSLVPYEALPDSEKEYDRQTAGQTLKAVLALGYRIEDPANRPPAKATGPAVAEDTRVTRAESPAPDGEPSAPPGDDMRDAPSDLPDDPVLRAELDRCREVLLPEFEKADRAARRFAWMQRRITVVSAVFGTLAVLVAIGEMSVPWKWLPYAEIPAVVVAFIGFAAGVIVHLHERWLLERHRAERYRLLKFRRITSLVRDGTGTEFKAEPDHLAEHLRAIAGLDPKGVHAWTREETLPEVVEAVPSGGPRHPRAEAVVDYYLRKRLQGQRQYFRDRAQRNQGWDRRLRRLPSLLFLGSVLAALLHFAAELVQRQLFGTSAAEIVRGPESALGWAAALFLLLAAGLPVVEAGIRALRSGFEFGRNTSRFEAVGKALDHLAGRLRAEPGTEAVYRALLSCEYLLEREHREWLRLMSEPEWSW